jgi:hypothetical protein
MLYPVLKLIARRFEVTKENRSQFSQDQKTAASEISNEKFQYILP